MFASRSEYDRGVNTFSPEGRLFQVEYAIEAIKFGSTAIAIRTDEGVVLSTEKRIQSRLIEPGSVEKIAEIDHHCACALSGLIADGKTLVDRARVEAQNHWFKTYNERMSIESITQAVSNLALAFSSAARSTSGKVAMSRPFGVAILFAGYDETGAHLFQLDPSGTFIEYKAKAIGSGHEGADDHLKQSYKDDFSLHDATKHSLDILKQVMEDKMTSDNVEVAHVTKDGFKVLSKNEVEQVMAE